MLIPRRRLQDLEKSLDMVGLEAILSDCEETMDAIMLAVQWGEPAIIQNQLDASKAHDSAGLARAFEEALRRRNAEVVKVRFQISQLAWRSGQTVRIAEDTSVVPHKLEHRSCSTSSIPFSILISRF